MTETITVQIQMSTNIFGQKILLRVAPDTAALVGR